ncbi:hypothetical protein X798_04382 [Onchocerca flexuosa]|uniref:Uncharacterized protein n=1 Tax=Onchocerca flexuosa TaxID=387005 RepID=A0A238BTB4_9BILA|nr:hypothetical protein X798_04382 [Onchocerca flexuosa]
MEDISRCILSVHIFCFESEYQLTVLLQFNDQIVEVNIVDQIKNTLTTRREEEEICLRLEETIVHANETYEKILESFQSLVDYIKKEYEDALS